MSLRTFNAGLATLSLAACGVGESPEPEGDTVECAIGEGADFASDCTLEWIGEAGKSEFLIHHPEGGFRRFAVNENASGVTAVDGAEETVMVDGVPTGLWQFSVSGDTYRMPIPAPSGV